MRIDNNFKFVIINKIQYFENMLMKKDFMGWNLKRADGW